MEVSYFINNKEVHRPLNYAELTIELNYDTDDQFSQAVTLTEFEWGLGSQVTSGLADAVVLIEAHKRGGLTGDVGVFEGLPFRIELTEGNKTRVPFDGYLNTSTALYDCDKIVLTAVEKGKIDWFRENADSQTFEGMFEEGVFTRSDFIPVPYVLSSIPDNKEALLSLVSVTFLSITIASELEDIIEKSVGLANPLDFMGVVKLILRIIYVIGLIITLAVLIVRIVNLMIQPVKYHDCMNVRKLCQIGADYFGMTFKSSILDTDPFNRLTILPKKYSHDISDVNNSDGSIDKILGFISPSNGDSKGYFIGTYGDLLRALKEIFNAKLIMDGNIIQLEREDFNTSANNYITPAVDQTDFRLNASDFKANYTVEFQRDFNDRQSINNYEGNITQAIRTPIATTNSDMTLMVGLESRLIPFARATRKERFTEPELIVRSIAVVFDPIIQAIVDVINSVIGEINTFIRRILKGRKLFGLSIKRDLQAEIDSLENLTGIDLGIDDVSDTDFLKEIEYVSIVDKIDARIGMLLMENDFVDSSKIFLLDEDADPLLTDISVDNATFINSEYLYNNFHFIRSFVVSSNNVNGNQYKIHKLTGVPFCFDEYELLRENNRLQDDLNRNGKLKSGKWNVEGGTIDLEFGINEAYTNNIKEEIITPDGK